MSDSLDAQLDNIFAARDRDNMGPTIDALLPIYEEHPENPRVLYDFGGAYDTAGEEATAPRVARPCSVRKFVQWPGHNRHR